MDIRGDYCFGLSGSYKDRDRIKDILSRLRVDRFICFHPRRGENFKAKSYHEDRFFESADLIIGKYDCPGVIYRDGKRE
ncbi:MAG: hypothetical protein WC300_04815 [Candidatus Omnitrophota bacterium]